mmetsp:Transcript_1085/g.3571  ORF Transcript_1085/g.3571 Transcript_1085/m.3571 type:complete len:336 (-) Transcript_1085:400-1407(-)
MIPAHVHPVPQPHRALQIRRRRLTRLRERYPIRPQMRPRVHVSAAAAFAHEPALQLAAHSRGQLVVARLRDADQADRQKRLPFRRVRRRNRGGEAAVVDDPVAVAVEVEHRRRQRRIAVDAKVQARRPHRVAARARGVHGQRVAEKIRRVGAFDGDDDAAPGPDLVPARRRHHLPGPGLVVVAHRRRRGVQAHAPGRELPPELLRDLADALLRKAILPRREHAHDEDEEPRRRRERGVEEDAGHERPEEPVDHVVAESRRLQPPHDRVLRRGEDVVAVAEEAPQTRDADEDLIDGRADRMRRGERRDRVDRVPQRVRDAMERVLESHVRAGVEWL